MIRIRFFGPGELIQKYFRAYPLCTHRPLVVRTARPGWLQIVLAVSGIASADCATIVAEVRSSGGINLRSKGRGAKVVGSKQVPLPLFEGHFLGQPVQKMFTFTLVACLSLRMRQCRRSCRDCRHIVSFRDASAHESLAVRLQCASWAWLPSMDILNKSLEFNGQAFKASHFVAIIVNGIGMEGVDLFEDWPLPDSSIKKPRLEDDPVLRSRLPVCALWLPKHLTLIPQHGIVSSVSWLRCTVSPRRIWQRSWQPPACNARP